MVVINVYESGSQDALGSFGKGGGNQDGNSQGSQYVGSWVSNFRKNKDKDGDVNDQLLEGYVMKLDADGGVHLHPTQFQTGFDLPGTISEMKSNRIGTWVDIGNNKIRVMTYDIYVSGTTHDLLTNSFEEYDRETRVLQYENGRLRQIAEVVVGVPSDNRKLEALGTTGWEDSYEPFVRDRYAENAVAAQTDSGFGDFIFDRMPNYGNDLIEVPKILAARNQ